jgi:rubrerythrin
MTPVHPDILAALTSGIQSEVAAYVFYLESSKKVESIDIKDALQQLASEEKSHFQILERQYDSLVRSEKWISTADVLKQKGLPEIGEEMASQHKELIAQVKKAGSKREILDMALKLETESRDMFRAAAVKSQSKEAKDTFEILARFEEGHIKLISTMIARG